MKFQKTSIAMVALLTGCFLEQSLQGGPKKMNPKDYAVSQSGLSHLLADISVLLFQTLHYHWNLEGKEFHDYHQLFNKQYTALFEDLDLVAERIRAIGGYANISMKDMLSKATLKEEKEVQIVPSEMIRRLEAQYGHMLSNMKDLIKKIEKKSSDFGTRKMLEDLVEKHEKTRWMLRSLVEKSN